ncbi:unnamed protein product [Caenorhabditis auriculariae]|uniref:Uncharacterized protein n=1 Tax=Caenorhabditis auriculariae TaxID=2777116 RepID=A0A8S1H8X8_9PELO|nr:unnamed protein product [Caenorhabditis auriculariae]
MQNSEVKALKSGKMDGSLRSASSLPSTAKSTTPVTALEDSDSNASLVPTALENSTRTAIGGSSRLTTLSLSDTSAGHHTSPSAHTARSSSQSSRPNSKVEPPENLLNNLRKGKLFGGSRQFTEEPEAIASHRKSNVMSVEFSNATCQTNSNLSQRSRASSITDHKLEPSNENRRLGNPPTLPTLPKTMDKFPRPTPPRRRVSSLGASQLQLTNPVKPVILNKDDSESDDSTSETEESGQEKSKQAIKKTDKSQISEKSQKSRKSMKSSRKPRTAQKKSHLRKIEKGTESSKNSSVDTARSFGSSFGGSSGASAKSFKTKTGLPLLLPKNAAKGSQQSLNTGETSARGTKALRNSQRSGLKPVTPKTALGDLSARSKCSQKRGTTPIPDASLGLNNKSAIGANEPLTTFTNPSNPARNDASRPPGNTPEYNRAMNSLFVNRNTSLNTKQVDRRFPGVGQSLRPQFPEPQGRQIAQEDVLVYDLARARAAQRAGLHAPKRQTEINHASRDLSNRNPQLQSVPQEFLVENRPKPGSTVVIHGTTPDGKNKVEFTIQMRIMAGEALKGSSKPIDLIPEKQRSGQTQQKPTSRGGAHDL